MVAKGECQDCVVRTGKEISVKGKKETGGLLKATHNFSLTLIDAGENTTARDSTTQHNTTTTTTHTHARTHIHKHTLAYVRTHNHTHIRARAHTHTYQHTHTRARAHTFTHVGT